MNKKTIKKNSKKNTKKHKYVSIEEIYPNGYIDVVEVPKGMTAQEYLDINRKEKDHFNKHFYVDKKI